MTFDPERVRQFVSESRLAQGLPETVTNLAAIDALVTLTLLRNDDPPPQRGNSSSSITNHAAKRKQVLREA